MRLSLRIIIYFGVKIIFITIANINLVPNRSVKTGIYNYFNENILDLGLYKRLPYFKFLYT